ILPSLLSIASLLYFLLINYLFGSTEQSWYVGIISGLTCGQIVQTVLTRRVYEGSAILSVQKGNHSNQAIRKSLINASIIAVITSLVVGLTKGFSQSASLGLIFWLLSGGIACVQHLALRIVLRYEGYTPCNYNKFLNYATEQTLLRRIGGSYEFVHRLLQEHLVDIFFESESEN
ncbi:MAG: hypothetical protein WA865_03315, partial [Spirulinaceae cyanobacterium]